MPGRREKLINKNISVSFSLHGFFFSHPLTFKLWPLKSQFEEIPMRRHVQEAKLTFCEATMTLTFDLQNQVILESHLMFEPKLIGFPCGVAEISCPQGKKTLYDATATMAFDLWWPNSNQFILESNWMFVPSLKESPQSVLKISCSQERDRWTTWKQNVSSQWLSVAQRHKKHITWCFI